MNNVIDSIKLSGTVYTLSAQTSGGGVPESAFTAYTASTNERISQDEEVTAAALNVLNESLSGKQDTLVSSTNIKTINNESLLGSGNITIQGGSTYTAGRGISIANDTISFSLPISAGTGTYSVIEGNTYNKASGSSSHAEGSNTSANGQFSHAEGINTKANGSVSHAEGNDTIANGNYSHAEGYGSKANGSVSHAEGNDTIANGFYSHAEGYGSNASGYVSHAEGSFTKANDSYSHAEGYYTITNNSSEHASGQYNVSNKAINTWGNSGNTLFSVGNGTATNARHNAFEIRQNGDIYLTKDGQDVKLQDQLGGSSITVDTALDSGSTNPVENRVIYNKIDEVEQVTARALNELNDNFGGLKLVKLTQAEYNALATKDPSTLYVIVD